MEEAGVSQNNATSLLEKLGFPASRYVRGRASVADMFRQGKRCGIYLLHCSNAEYYAGQATDVTRRYIQHRKTHADIERISFKRVRRDRLDIEERRVIWALEEAGIYLRNIALTSIPHGASDFDLIMSPEEQERWLVDLHHRDVGGERVEDYDLRSRYRSKYQRFKRMPYAAEVTEVLREYVPTGIPAVRRGEVSFWSCSCLPAYSNPMSTVYSRVNVNWQEVFTAHTSGEELFFSWHLARSSLEKGFNHGLSGLVRQHPAVKLSDHRYEPGGQDQVNISVRGIGPALDLIRDKSILSAVRLFNCRLMRKGPCAYSRYHSLDLADSLVSV